MSDAAPAEFASPPGLPHYEPAETITRTIEFRGVLWAVTYHAAWDGIGWLVNRCTAHPVEGIRRYVHAGETGLLRANIRQDWGDRLLVSIIAPGVPIPPVEVPRAALVGLDWTPR